MHTQIVILAAGQGKRMHSTLPKVLHRLAGKSLIEHVIQTARALDDGQPIIIYGHQGDILRKHLPSYPLQWVEQKDQLGTGHALLQALPVLQDNERALILSGDVPLISQATLKKLIESTPVDAIGMVTAYLDEPFGYGRVKRDKANHVASIIEEKDASAEERDINEINTGIYLVPVTFLKKCLPLLKNTNAQREYYLTDIITHAVKEKVLVQTVQPQWPEEVEGVNDKLQLAKLERFYQARQADILMRQGVTIMDPARLDIRGEVTIGKDVSLDANVILEGRVVIGDGCVIGSNVYLKDVVLGERVEIRPNSVLEETQVAAACIIGPFARLRPGTKLAEQVHIGNFVEVKNSIINQETKINHLSYIGDSDIGKQVNIGAGTITCNYDGANKHRTVIGDHVHIGSDTQLVAPVTIGEGATLGAGSTVTRNAPPHQLTLTHRLEQRSFSQWERPKKREKADKS